MQIRFSRFQVVGTILTVLAVLAFSAFPAFGQETPIEEGDDVQYSAICQTILGSVGGITSNQTANANAAANTNVTADGESTVDVNNEAVAGEISQKTGVSIEQVNECLNGAAADDTSGTDDTDTTETDSSEAAAAVDSPEGVKSASIPEVKALVNTGGIPLLAGAGLVLVASVVVGYVVIGRR